MSRKGLILPLAGLILSAGFAVYSSLSLVEDARKKQQEIARLRDSTVALGSSLERGNTQEWSELKAQIEALANSRGEPSASLDATKTEAISMRNDLAALSARLASLENAILESPERALSLPLLKRDIEAIAARNLDQRESLRLEIDRLYTVLLWIAGILASIVAGVVTWGVSEIWKWSRRARVAAATAEAS